MMFRYGIYYSVFEDMNDRKMGANLTWKCCKGLKSSFLPAGERIFSSMLHARSFFEGENVSASNSSSFPHSTGFGLMEMLLEHFLHDWRCAYPSISPHKSFFALRLTKVIFDILLSWTPQSTLLELPVLVPRPHERQRLPKLIF